MIVGAVFESYYFILIGGDELIVNLAWCSVWILVNLVQMFILFKEKWSAKFTEREKIIHKLSFSSLSDVNFRQLLNIAEWKKAEENTVLIEESTELNNLIFITQGVAKVESHDHVTAFIGDGNFAGEMSFISQELTTAQVTAITPIEYLSWEREKLYKLLKKSKEIEEGLKTIFNLDLVKKLSKMMVKKEE
jgi:CRP-like cAMP-binding protein